MSAGAHTQAYSLAALVSILGVLLFARPVLASFPLATLGALVIYAALPTAVAAYRQWVKEHLQQGPDQARSESCSQVPDTAPGPCETDQQSPGEKEAGDDR